VAHCCYEHADQTSVPRRALRASRPSRDEVRRVAMDDDERVQLESADEEIVARVAAIDVAKDSGMVCTRVPHPTSPRRRTTTVWRVPARTGTIMNLAERLAVERIERVVLESTSEYWRPFYYLLEARGLTVWVVNACEVKNVPG